MIGGSFENAILTFRGKKNFSCTMAALNFWMRPLLVGATSLGQMSIDLCSKLAYSGERKSTRNDTTK